MFEILKQLGAPVRRKPITFAAHLELDALEDRTAPATFIVNSTDDFSDDDLTIVEALDKNGKTTLRAALEQAHDLGGSHTIQFAIGNVGSLQTIFLSKDLTPVTKASVTIDGYTQIHPASKNPVPLIVIDGQNMFSGLTFQNTDNNVVRWLTFNRCDEYGIIIEGNKAESKNPGNTVEFCYIGFQGIQALPNDVGIIIAKSDSNVLRYNTITGNSLSGVQIDQGSSYNILYGNYVGVLPDGVATAGKQLTGVFIDASDKNYIGFLPLGPANVISGNKEVGVLIANAGADGNIVAGNIIGLDALGKTSVPNVSIGVAIRSGNNNIIGGMAQMNPDKEGSILTPVNIISGNGGAGISIQISNGNKIVGNFIGVAADGTDQKVGNGGNGIQIITPGPFTANDNIIGMVGSGRNVIASNTGFGIEIAGLEAKNNVIEGNRVGVDNNGKEAKNTAGGIEFSNEADKTLNKVGKSNEIAYNGTSGVIVLAGTGVTITQNSIHSNVALGIDLGPVGVTPNDPGDTDMGPNKLQNYPVIQSATVVGSTTVVVWSIDSWKWEGPPEQIPPGYSVYPISVEFFDNTVPDPSGFGEGEIYLATVVVPGPGTYTTTLPAASYVTATATDADGNTSEFSAWLLGGPTALSINDVTQNEGNSGTTNFTFTVTLSVAVANQVTVAYSVLDGSATVADNDYIAGSGTVTFDPWQTSKTIIVQVNGDNKFELAEQFYVKLSNATNAAIADNMGVGTINNDDVQPSITINDVTQIEGNSGTTNFVFTVSLSNASSSAITVDFATGDGTATAPGDYAAQSGTVTFNPGEITKTITIAVVGDTVGESHEYFNVNLSNPANATLADLIGQGFIQNDDTTINIGDATMTEGQFGFKLFTFNITLSHASALTVTSNWATANGTATAGSDYQAGSGSVTFNPGEMMKTVTVMVTGDMTPEANETFYVDLSSIVNAMFGDMQGLATILNDD